MTKVKLPQYQSIKIVEAAEIAKIEGQTMLLSFRKHVAKVEVGVSLDIENYCTLRLFFDLPNLAGLSRRNLPADGIRLLFHI